MTAGPAEGAEVTRTAWPRRARVVAPQPSGRRCRRESRPGERGGARGEPPASAPSESLGAPVCLSVFDTRDKGVREGGSFRGKVRRRKAPYFSGRFVTPPGRRAPLSSRAPAQLPRQLSSSRSRTPTSATAGGAGQAVRRASASVSPPLSFRRGRGALDRESGRSRRRAGCLVTSATAERVAAASLGQRPSGSRLGIFKSGGAFPFRPTAPPPPPFTALASQRQARHFSNPLPAANQDLAGHSSPDRF